MSLVVVPVALVVVSVGLVVVPVALVVVPVALVVVVVPVALVGALLVTSSRTFVIILPGIFLMSLGIGFLPVAVEGFLAPSVLKKSVIKGIEGSTRGVCLVLYFIPL